MKQIKIYIHCALQWNTNEAVRGWWGGVFHEYRSFLEIREDYQLIDDESILITQRSPPPLSQPSHNPPPNLTRYKLEHEYETIQRQD